MITDTMTWQEIREYHRKLLFKISMNKDFIKYTHKIKFNRFRKAEDGIIFNGIKEFNLGNNDSIIHGTFLVSKTLDKGEILFSIFRYKKEKYVCQYLEGGDVYFFRWHALKRYFERFYGDKEPQISKVDIAKMLIYNGDSITDDYIHQGKNHFNCLIRTMDGVFRGYYENDITIIKTFITEEMQKGSQIEVSNKSIEELRDCMRDKYGFDILKDLKVRNAV